MKHPMLDEVSNSWGPAIASFYWDQSLSFLNLLRLVKPINEISRNFRSWLFTAINWYRFIFWGRLGRFGENYCSLLSSNYQLICYNIQKEAIQAELDCLKIKKKWMLHRNLHESLIYILISMFLFEWYRFKYSYF